jgi:hypothetical protein
VADLLAQGNAWLEDQRHRYLTLTVTYRRGDQSVQVQATIGRTIFRLDAPSDGFGVTTRYVSRDYLVRATDLVLNGEQTLPQRGDQIVEASGGGTVHEVMGPGGGEPDWRFSDPQRLTLRIHTKEIPGP